jgi:hypothetical protein
LTPRRQSAHELVELLASEPAGLPRNAIAQRLHRRRAVAQAILRADPRFAHSGWGRRSRWRLAAAAPPNGPPEHVGTEKGCCPHCGQPLPSGNPDGRAGDAGGEQEA